MPCIYKTSAFLRHFATKYIPFSTNAFYEPQNENFLHKTHKTYKETFAG